MSVNIIKIQQTSLQAPLGSTDSSVAVNEFVDSQGNTVSLSDFGEFFTIVIKQGDTVEIVKCDGITQNSDGSADLDVATNGRDVSPKPSYTGSATGNDFSAGAQVTVTNDPLIISILGNTENENTWQEVQTFAKLAKTTAGNPTADDEYARKGYVDATATGSATTDSIVVSGTAGATVSAGDLVYLDDSDSEWKLCDANTAATVENVILGIAQGSGTDGNPISNGVLLSGLDTNQSSLTANNIYYASNTPGEITTTPGATEVTIGIATDTTDIVFMPRFDQRITEDQQDALAGSSGSPSSTNTYVTEDDVSDAAASGKIVRATGTALPALDGSNLTGTVSADKYLGDGHDGSATISTGTQLSEDKYYTDLTIDSGAELDPNGYKIFCTGTLTVDNGKIIRTGGAGSTGQGGQGSGSATGGSGGSLSAGTLPAGTPGADGGDGLSSGTSEAGGSGTAVDHALGKAGQAGGAGGDGNGSELGGAGGSGSAANAPTRPLVFGVPLFEFVDVDIEGDGIVGYKTNGQAGGGGGGGGEDGATDTGAGGGGGGADGGTILVYAKDIVVNASGSIEANGGDGGDGGDGSVTSQNAGGGGGGAGGNGGVVVLVYTSSYTNNGTVQALGGAGGTGGSSGSGADNGTNGSSGSAGTIITKQV